MMEDKTQACYGCNGEGYGIPTGDGSLMKCNRCDNVWWDRTKSAKLNQGSPALTPTPVFPLHDPTPLTEAQRLHGEIVVLRAENERLRGLLRSLVEGAESDPCGFWIMGVTQRGYDALIDAIGDGNLAQDDSTNG